MILDKYLNHIKWLLNALKEHNKIIKNDINNKLENEPYKDSINYKKCCSLFLTYCKLLQNFDKEYQTALNSNNLKKYILFNIYKVYLVRIINVFKDSGYYLKMSRQEMIYIKDSFGIHFQEMKQVANLLLVIQQDFIVILKNLH